MSEQFDGYYKWLGIPPKDQPPNHYRLLGIELYEDNPEVVEASAERQATYLHEVSAGPYVKESQKLLNEIAAARLCLLDAEKKAAYDAELRSKVTANVTVDALSSGHSPLDDLPWDNLEPLMTNGSSSDTAPKGQAASETLRLPAADPSGVFSKPKSLMAANPEPQAKPESKTSRPAMFWIAIGGGVAIVIALAVVAVLRLNSVDEAAAIISEQPQRDAPEGKTPKNPDKADAQSKKKDETPKQPAQRANGNDRKNDKKDDAKKDNDNKVQTNQGNDNKQPVEVAVTPKADQAGNNTTNGTTDPKNGSGKQPDVENKPIRTKAFLPLEPLELDSLKQESGTLKRMTFRVLDDKSVLALNDISVPVNNRRLEDVYSFQLKTDLPDLTAIRIDAMPSNAINYANGPGHGNDGSFAISEVRVAAAPVDNPDKIKVIELSGVESEEVPKSIERVIDGEDVAPWSVRNGGKQTTLTLFLKNEVWYENGSLLYVQITQPEKLGRFRVSVSNDPELVGRKTRIEATLPLLVNLGGRGMQDEVRRNWQASRPFDGGAYGYVGGKPEGNDASVVLTCISGIKEFRATVPDGKYDVLLFFSGRCPRDADKRSFHVSALGIEKKTIQNIPKRQTVATIPLKGVEAKDGGLTIQFEPGKSEPVLNGILVELAK